jgi:hypothetical protein
MEMCCTCGGGQFIDNDDGDDEGGDGDEECDCEDEDCDSPDCEDEEGDDEGGDNEEGCFANLDWIDENVQANFTAYDTDGDCKISDGDFCTFLRETYAFSDNQCDVLYMVYTKDQAYEMAQIEDGTTEGVCPEAFANAYMMVTTGP